MRRQEKVAEGLECPINESDIHWEGSGAQRHHWRPDPGIWAQAPAAPSPGLTLLSSENAQGDAQAWVCISKQDLRSAQPW